MDDSLTENPTLKFSFLEKAYGEGLASDETLPSVGQGAARDWSTLQESLLEDTFIDSVLPLQVAWYK